MKCPYCPWEGKPKDFERHYDEAGHGKETKPNSVDINSYVSKITFDLKGKTITVFGTDGKVLWGVSES